MSKSSYITYAYLGLDIALYLTGIRERKSTGGNGICCLRAKDCEWPTIFVGIESWNHPSNSSIHYLWRRKDIRFGGGWIYDPIWSWEMNLSYHMDYKDDSDPFTLATEQSTIPVTHFTAEEKMVPKYCGKLLMRCTNFSEMLLLPNWTLALRHFIQIHSS